MKYLNNLLTCTLLAIGCIARPASGQATLDVTLSPPTYLNVWFSGEKLSRAKFTDTEDVKLRMKGQYTFKNLQPGKYLVALDPDYENYSGHCIGYTNVVITPGLNTVTISVPTNQLAATVIFPDDSLPNFPLFGRIPLRVERLTVSGKVDPIYRQWLMVNKAPPHTDNLHDLDAGTYRFTSFTGHKSKLGENIDISRADIVIDQKTLDEGSIEIILKKLKPSASEQPRKK